MVLQPPSPRLSELEGCTPGPPEVKFMGCTCVIQGATITIIIQLICVSLCSGGIPASQTYITGGLYPITTRGQVQGFIGCIIQLRSSTRQQDPYTVVELARMADSGFGINQCPNS